MLHRGIALACLLAIGCGEPPAADAGIDGGTDAGRMRRDAGTDAGLDAGPPPTGCELWTGDAGPDEDGSVLSDPGAFAPPIGPGAPSVAFTESELLTPCAYLPLGPTDENHHNGGFFLDGYLVRAWAHERGRGGIAVWDLHDACHPTLVANALDDQIRETHATGLSNIDGRWIAVASLSGVEIWDVSDVTAPARVMDFALPGVRYPDAYMRTIMSVFWQAPYLYLGGSDNGVFVVDARDPTSPQLIAQFAPVPRFRVGQVIVIGNLMYAFSSEGSVAAIFDVSDPGAPRPIPGGTIRITNGSTDRFGRPTALPAYFGHVNGGRTYHTRIGLGGGLAMFDVRDPSAPAFLGDFDASDGNGGYVFIKEGMAFTGMSDYGVIVDVRDPTAPSLIAHIDYTGDVDTLTPFGNVFVVSVDDDAIDGQASAVIPFAAEVDATAPEVNMVVPADGATELALTTRVGFTFTEFVDMSSVWRGSVMVRELESGRLIEGDLSGQEGVVNFWPRAPLRPSTTYEVLVPAGGVTDLNGNAITAAHRSTFTTVACEG